MNLFKSFFLFLSLHRALVVRSLFVDIALLALGIGYLLFPSTELTYSISNGIFLFFIILSLTIIHVRLLAVYAGGPAFYRQLPVSGFSYLVLSKAFLYLPFVFSFLAAGGLLFAVGLLIPGLHLPVGSLLLNRSLQVLFFFAAVKSFAAPTMLLLRKHPLFLGIFYFMLIPIVLSVMILHEVAWAPMKHALLWDFMTFLVLLTGLESWVLRNAV